ncbi:MAG: carcinine hydrolase/isopenicillin-N N-acyltransferase family protein, partial [Synergistaceae bacterium]|nr:carcinine hydrolase/isopenicillin-N N-acyltransferase family protein [Synergistaceae bacterium]
VAVWGDYAQNGLVFGRNYDYCEWLKDFAKDFVFTAFHPADGSLAALTASYAGEIYAVNGINEKGIFLELNNASYSGGNLLFENRKFAAAELFKCLLDSSTLDEVDSFFQTTKADFAYMIGVSDGQIARCYEWPTFGVKLRKTHTRPGLIVLTNHFTEPSWGLPQPDDAKSFCTRERRDNLLSLAKHFKGSIDVETMKDIMDTKLESGGSKFDATVYQLVVEPGKFLIWFKISDVQDWTLLDAKPFLRPRQA